jgi:hypothetical protein
MQLPVIDHFRTIMIMMGVKSIDLPEARAQCCEKRGWMFHEKEI